MRSMQPLCGFCHSQTVSESCRAVNTAIIRRASPNDILPPAPCMVDRPSAAVCSRNGGSPTSISRSYGLFRHGGWGHVVMLLSTTDIGRLQMRHYKNILVTPLRLLWTYKGIRYSSLSSMGMISLLRSLCRLLLKKCAGPS